MCIINPNSATSRSIFFFGQCSRSIWILKFCGFKNLKEPPFFFLLRQASFKLSWRCKGERNDQHKHDIVSFEKGNISTAGRSNKQVHFLSLNVPFSWMTDYLVVLDIISIDCLAVESSSCMPFPNPSLVNLCSLLLQISLKWETHPQAVLIFTKPNSNSVRILCAEMVRWVLLKLPCFSFICYVINKIGCTLCYIGIIYRLIWGNN